jgi:flavin-dependent dehydrogenase
MAQDPREYPGTIVVVGGGPGGAFFAMKALKLARDRGLSTRVVIL